MTVDGTFFFRFAFILSGIYLFFKILGFLTKLDGENWILLFKALVYGALAFVIYRYYIAMGTEKIPVVDAFTFCLSCFECATSIGALMESIYKKVVKVWGFFKISE